ncbi:MAG: endosialidase [Eubacteriales bacterium]
MPVIRTLIKTEQDGGISFGNYELEEKTKRSDFEFEGNVYKVKTFSGITRLERNELFAYESVPGTAVTGLRYTEDGMEFTVEGRNDAQITVEGEPGTVYTIFLNGKEYDAQKTSLGGKLSFSVELGIGKPAEVKIRKA